MSDALHLTRRGVFHFLTTFFATVIFAARRPILAPPSAIVADAEPVAEARARKTRARRTKLETFLKSRGIKPAHLARESGYSRQHLLRIRLGQMEPTRRCMVEVTTACCRLAREHVRVADLFDLHPARVLSPSTRERGGAEVVRLVPRS